LIDVTFGIDEANKVLSQLLQSKINYHNAELFGNRERFNKDVEHNNTRIGALKLEVDAFKIIIDEARINERVLNIDYQLNISY
jgi:hypothetical protein